MTDRTLPTPSRAIDRRTDEAKQRHLMQKLAPQRPTGQCCTEASGSAVVGSFDLPRESQLRAPTIEAPILTRRTGAEKTQEPIPFGLGGVVWGVGHAGSA